VYYPSFLFIKFETPLPPLQPAVFAPVLKDLPPPALDLFDLDENFASEKVRLAQLTNKCKSKYFFLCNISFFFFNHFIFILFIIYI